MVKIRKFEITVLKMKTPNLFRQTKKTALSRSEETISNKKEALLFLGVVQTCLKIYLSISLGTCFDVVNVFFERMSSLFF